MVAYFNGDQFDFASVQERQEGPVLSFVKGRPSPWSVALGGKSVLTFRWLFFYLIYSPLLALPHKRCISAGYTPSQSRRRQLPISTTVWPNSCCCADVTLSACVFEQFPPILTKFCLLFNICIIHPVHLVM